MLRRQVLPNLKTETVRRSDRAKGFVPLLKRWIVKRRIAWLNRCRRLAKDWENRSGRAQRDAGAAFSSPCRCSKKGSRDQGAR